MKINAWLLTVQGQIGLAMSLFVILFLMIWIAPIFMAPLIISLIPIVGYVVVYNASFLTILLFSLLFLRIQELIPALEPFRVVLICTLLLCISFVINLFFRKITAYWSPEMIYFIVFFILVSMGVVLSYDFSSSFSYWSEGFLKIGILFFIIAWTLTDQKDFSWIIGVIVIGGFILSGITLYNTVNSVGLVEGSRATLGVNEGGVIGDPNDLALNLLISFSFSLSLFYSIYSSVTIRILSFITSLVMVCGIAATKSRGGLLGVCAIFLFFLYPRIARSKLLLIPLGIGLILLLYMVAGISHRESGGGLDVSALNRIAAWKAAVNMAFHHPFFGVGLNQFVNNFYNYASSSVLDNPLLRTDMEAHSIWFGVLAEAGILGLIFFIACIHSAFKITKMVINKLKVLNYETKGKYEVYMNFASGLQGALIGYCVAGSFLSQAFTGILYFLFALSIALSHSIHLSKNYDENK